MSISALHTALTGMQAAQTNVETASHNIANASTDGYTRQRVVQGTPGPRQAPGGWAGSGTRVITIERARDALIDARVRAGAGQSAYSETRASGLSRAEAAFAEPDQGITSGLANLWASFIDLSTRPGDLPVRQNVLSALDDIAARFNSTRAELDLVADDTAVHLTGEISNANDLINRITALNKMAGAPGGLPADLADERDRAGDQLAASIGAKVTVGSDNLMRVTTSGLAIVDGDFGVKLGYDPNVPGVISHPVGPVTIGGTAGGLQRTLLVDLPGIRSSLDTFATTLVTALNTLHAAGLKPDGTAGGPLLSDVAGVMSVVPTSVNDLAAADGSGGPQNANNATALADLAQPMDAEVRKVVGGLAADVATARRAADTDFGLAQASSETRNGLTGVNMDEEMVALITHQRSYAAAARVISTVDEMLQSLMAM